MRIQTVGGRKLTDPTTSITLASLRHLEELGKDSFVDNLRRIEKEARGNMAQYSQANDKLKEDIKYALALNKANMKKPLMQNRKLKLVF